MASLDDEEQRVLLAVHDSAIITSDSPDSAVLRRLGDRGLVDSRPNPLGNFAPKLTADGAYLAAALLHPRHD